VNERPVESRPPAVRLRQGLAILAGALLFALVAGAEPDRFYLTPLGLGLIYLAAAALGGRRGGYWATAVVLVGWGAAVFWARQGRPDLDTAGLYLLGAGIGATAGVLLGRRGFAVDPLGLTATIAAAGLLLALAPRWPEVLQEARTYALLVGAVGLANAVAGAISLNASR
jgi:hypothetical protein